MKKALAMTVSSLCFLLFSIPSVADAEPVPSAEQAVEEEKIESKNKSGSTDDGKSSDDKKSGLVPLAIPYYMPETSFGIGFYLLYYNNPDPANPEIRPNEISLYGAVTLKEQLSVGISTDRYFRGRDFKLSGAVEFSRFPDLFWGVGPDTKEDSDEKFTSITENVRGSFLFEVYRNILIGPCYKFINDYMQKTKIGGLLRRGDIPGSDGTMISGPGINFNWDTRDHTFFPLKGFYIDIKAYVNRKEIGSEYNFSKLEIDMRKFFQIYKEHVIGIQGMSEITFGTVPFQAMTRLGGEMMMRGYYQGRFRDTNFIAFQTEYRFPIYWRFAGVLFGSLGQVASKADEFSIHNLKVAWGTGIRFIADKSEHIPIRLDIGFDRELNPNFYFIVKEAF